jgi:hypothetical protein
MKRLLLALGLAALASLGICLLWSRAPKPVPHELARVQRPGTEEYAVAYSINPPEFRNGWIHFYSPKLIHWKYKVCLEGSRERASHKRGPVVWESRDVAPDSMAWLTRDSLRVDVARVIYPRRYWQSVRVHRHRGVVVTTEGLTSRTE